MPTISELVTSGNFKDYILESNLNETPLLGDALFPADKQLGLDLTFLKGSNGLPVVLKASAFDANAPLRSRIGVTGLTMEMPFFRERYSINEKQRQELNNLLSGGRTAQADFIIRNVFNDAKNLTDGAKASVERMRMQLLSTGKVTIFSEGANHEYDYGIDDATQKVTLTLTDAWDDPSSTPITDLIAWQRQVVANTGQKPTRAIMNSKTFGYLANNITIRQDLNPLGAANIILTDDDVVAYLSRKLGMQFAVYDNMYIDELGAAQNYFPDNVVTLLPPSELGRTVYGTTPEESDLLNGIAQADVSIVDTGVAITSYQEIHPVTSVIMASQIVLPSFPMANKIFIATVA